MSLDYVYKRVDKRSSTQSRSNTMTDTDILARHNFTPEQAANAMRKSPAKRTPQEQALVRDLVNHA